MDAIGSSRARQVVASLCVSLLAVADAHAATGEEMARTHAPAIGQPAPDATLDIIDGKRIELGDLYGRQPVYLKFWATWCVPCRQQMPHFEAAWQRYHDRVARPRIGARAHAGVGDRAPAFSVQAAGSAWDFKPGKMGKPTVLAFITPWCESYLKDSRPEVAAACRKTREALTQAYRAAPAQSAWLAIASRIWSTEADLPDYQRQLQVDYPVALDGSGEIFRRYGIKEVPTVVIVDAAGAIRQRFDGFSPELAGALASLNGS